MKVFCYRQTKCFVRRKHGGSYRRCEGDGYRTVPEYRDIADILHAVRRSHQLECFTTGEQELELSLQFFRFRTQRVKLNPISEARFNDIYRQQKIFFAR